MHLFERRL